MLPTKASPTDYTTKECQEESNKQSVRLLVIAFGQLRTDTLVICQYRCEGTRTVYARWWYKPPQCDYAVHAACA